MKQVDPLTAGRPPNIVFVFADDLGIGDLSVYGGEVINTPNIDQLAATGVRFTQGYMTHAVCSPSRAGLLTGRYQQRHGWEFNPAGRDVDNGMSIDERTMADVLKADGYATGLIGKWHLGYQDGHHPLARGFDEYFGVLAGGSNYIDPAVPGVEYVAIGPTRHPRPARIAVFRGREIVEVEDYLTDVFTDEAVAFI
ncbi:MAG: sulfatase-like hydrolase/transferase, partial [Pseudomonadota bacterium]|nr:sulfatase-like hydrolase/transferase [Pseudomonadota bacterium]